MERPVAVMSPDLYARIVRECGENHCREIQLHHFGEPLIDPNLEEKVRLAKAAGVKKVKFFSNGSLLTEERSRALIDAGLDEIAVSFDGETPDEYERIRTPLRFDTVINNIKNLIALKNAAKSPLRIRIACCTTGNIAETIALLPQEGIDKFSFGKTHSWASGDGAAVKKIRKPCSRVWHTFTILANGQVALCCLDYDGKVILGDVASGQTIKEIYNSPPYRRIRRLHATGGQNAISLCAMCEKAFM